MVKNEYHMLKEINEQPQVIRKLIKRHIDLKKYIVVFKELAHHQDELRKISRITLLGCGTSFHAAMLGNYLFEEITGLPCEFELAEEFSARKIVVEKKTAVIIASQSGETAAALTAAYKAKGKGAFLIAVTNKPNSLLARTADVAISIAAGEEVAVAATKTFTTELMVLSLLAIFIRQRRKPPTIRIKKYIEEIITLPDKIRKTIKMNAGLKKVTASFKKIRQMVVLGEKYNYPIALETALKLKETAYIKAEGMETREFKHGPMALIKKNFPVLLIAPKDSTFKDNLEIASEIKKYGGLILAITTAGNRRLYKLTEQVMFIPKTLEMFNPILTVIVVQLLAYHLARQKSIDVDQPRHLSKFVK